MGISTGHTRVSGADIYYITAGDGPPLLLIMGLAGSVHWWGEEFLALLARDFKFLAYDHRGAGRSSLPEGPYTIPVLAEDAASLMEAVGWDWAFVAGFSMGGMIAQELALTRPELVRKLVLISTFCGGHEAIQPEPEIASLINSTKEGIPVETLARGTAWLLFPPEYLQEYPEAVEDFAEIYLKSPISPLAYAKQVEAVKRWGSYSRLPRIGCPTLVLTGDRDVVIPPGNSRMLAERIPGATLKVITRAGHGLTLQRPRDAAEAISGFLLERREVPSA